MEFCNKFIFFLISPFFFDFSTEAARANNQRPFNNNVSAIIVFGDSTVDSGNNNYIETTVLVNFLPYGTDLPEHPASGRFSNGRVITDITAAYVGVKELVPPYLDPTLDIGELLSGVNFASGGAGYDPSTSNQNNIITMLKQLDYFNEYKKKLESAIGRAKMEDHLKRAVFYISSGSNDFLLNYVLSPNQRKRYSVLEYQQIILKYFKTFIQNLWDEGARKIAVSGLPPLGCPPSVITLLSEDPLLHRGCIQNTSQIAVGFNIMLKKELNLMQNKLANQGAKIYYADLYNPLLDLIQGAGKSEFEVVSYGCCGSGYVELGFLCNPHSSLCPDRSKYVYFDSAHPTEKAFYKIFESIRNVIDLLIKN